MILENYTGTAHSSVLDNNEYMGLVIGESSELAEILSQNAADMHNLTVALARFEHKCIVENASPYALNEGINSWFQNAKDFIVKMWKKFVAWLKGLWDNLRTSVFGPRKDWLKDHESELMRMQKFGDAKVTIGKNIGPGFADAIGTLGSGPGLVSLMKPFENDKTTEAGIRDAITTKLIGGRVKDGQTVASYFEDKLIGAKEETALNRVVVGKLLAAVHDTSKMVDTIPALLKKADEAVKIVENAAKTALGEATLFEADSDYEKNFPGPSDTGRRSDMPNYQQPSDGSASRFDGSQNKPKDSKYSQQRTDDQNKAHADLSRRRLEVSKIYGHVFQTVTSALLNTGTSANGQAMSALVKAYHAGKRHLGESAGYGITGNVLADFM